MSSEWGDIVAALEGEARAVWPDLRAGVLGFERALRVAAELSDAELPKVFAHSISENTSIDELGQEEATFSCQLDLWLIASQEDVAVRLDLFVARLRANPRLGGLVERAFVSARSIREFSGLEKRGGAVRVEAVRRP